MLNMLATDDIVTLMQIQVVEDVLQRMRCPQLSPNLLECLLYVFNQHPVIARPRSEWLNLHAGDARVLMQVVLPLLRWSPYVVNVETDRRKHRDYGID